MFNFTRVFKVLHKLHAIHILIGQSHASNFALYIIMPIIVRELKNGARLNFFVLHWLKWLTLYEPAYA